MIVSRNRRLFIILNIARLEKILDELIDEVRGNDKHALAVAMQIIGENLEQFDTVSDTVLTKSG